MRKALISLFILIQVGSNLYVNPDHVAAVKDGARRSCKTVIYTSGGENNYICSDWEISKVLSSLKNWRNLKF